MMRVLARGVVAAACLAGLLLGAGCQLVGGSGPQAIVIGVDLNLSGAGSHLDTVHHNALQLQVERLNQQQRRSGRRLVLRVRDNRNDPAVAAGNLAELSADPEVTALITGSCGACVVAAAEDLAGHRMPTISLAATAAVVTPAAERRYVFKLGPDAGDNADRLSQELAETGAATVGLVTVDDRYGEEGAQGMTDAAGRDGLAIVSHQRVRPGDRDGAAAAAQAVAGWRPDPLAQVDPLAPPAPPAGPDAVVLWTYPPEAVATARALRAAGYGGPLFLDAVAADELFLPEPALAGATLVFTSTPVIDRLIATSLAAAARKQWVSAYLARYGTYHVPASWAADAVQVVADAVRRAGGEGRPDREVVRDKLESTRLDGLTGVIRYTADQHSGLHPSSLQLLTASDRWR